ncbi:MAG TPA: MASE1 domain-containing protein [Pyrinomonadaceae bacterium]
MPIDSQQAVAKKTVDIRYILSIFVLAAVYFAAAKFGLSLASVHTNVSPVWPPTGIALAAVLLLGYRVWPGILLGAFLANALTPVTLATAGAIAVGNTLEAVIAAVALNALAFRPSLDRALDVFKFVAVAVGCTMISATIGTLSLGIGHAAAWSSFPLLWLTWWLGDLTGAVTVAPLLLTWSTGTEHLLPKHRYLEATLLILLLSVSAIVTFGGSSPISVHYYPLSRLMIPFILWAAFRLGRRGVTVAIAVVSAFAIWGTSHGYGPFISDTANASLLMLQLFIASNAVTFLFLVAVVEEKRLAEGRRREDQRRLEANLAVTRVLAESPEVGVALQRILPTVGETLGWEFGCAWVPADDGKVLRSIATWQATPKPQFEAVCRERTFDPGIGLPGRVCATLSPAWISDVTEDDNFPRAPIAAAEGLHGAFAFPILFDQKFLGVMEFFSGEIRKPDEALLEMFEGIGNQIGQFVERKRAEEALEPSSRLPAENPAPVMRLDAGRVCSYANPAAQRILSGWDLSLGKEAPTEIVELATAALADGNRRDFELRLGEQTYFVNFAPVVTSGYVNLYFTDITSLKQTESALLQNQQWLSLTMESSRLGTWTRELDGSNHVKWSPELERIFGLEPGEFPETEQAFFDFVHPEDRKRVATAVAEAIENGTTYDVEFRYTPKNGYEGWMLGRGRAFYDITGKPYRLAGLGWDITERKRSEETLRHFAAIVESTDDAVISKDLNGIITSWNRAAENLYGFSAEEALGQPVSMLIPQERPDEEPLIQARLQRGERIDHYETVRTAKDGRRIPVSLTVSPIKDANGTIIGASKIARDISEQKRVQEEIAGLLAREREARQEAEIANRAKDEFLAVLSHELRTPLTAMLGWLSILRDHRLDNQTTEHAIETIERNAKAQAQLIEDLVDVSRIVGGKLNLEVRPIDLIPVINAAIEVVRPAADAKNIAIDVNYDPKVGPVSGDSARLQQIIWNLLSNAVKFTPKGGSVYVEFRREGAFAEIVVRDTGIGIAPDFLPHAFERFRQAESTATRAHKGMGLGLAIVRHLVELHGGTVSAASDGENRGSTFTVHLPLATVRRIMPAATRARESNGADANALLGLRILLVEDEPDARELISMVLQGSGANVEAVDSATGALQRLPLFIPHLLLSDIGLPRESGYDLIRKVRALASDLNKVPAIALTAFATENDRQMSLTAGFQAHLAKPVEPSDLLETIKVVINGKS